MSPSLGWENISKVSTVLISSSFLFFLFFWETDPAHGRWLSISFLGLGKFLKSPHCNDFFDYFLFFYSFEKPTQPKKGDSVSPSLGWENFSNVSSVVISSSIFGLSRLLRNISSPRWHHLPGAGEQFSKVSTIVVCCSIFVFCRLLRKRSSPKKVTSTSLRGIGSSKFSLFVYIIYIHQFGAAIHRRQKSVLAIHGPDSWMGHEFLEYGRFFFLDYHVPHEFLEYGRFFFFGLPRPPWPSLCWIIWRILQ